MRIFSNFSFEWLLLMSVLLLEISRIVCWMELGITFWLIFILLCLQNLFIANIRSYLHLIIFFLSMKLVYILFTSPAPRFYFVIALWVPLFGINISIWFVFFFIISMLILIYAFLLSVVRTWGYVYEHTYLYLGCSSLILVNCPWLCNMYGYFTDVDDLCFVHKKFQLLYVTEAENI